MVIQLTRDQSLTFLRWVEDNHVADWNDPKHAQCVVCRITDQITKQLNIEGSVNDAVRALQVHDTRTS